ncbi:MAG TPA: SDR family NAD(P)-dependent oxidoreductase [Sandaracinaceae bacterium LLY-WYZ-13_1]|nr:SDR family NAD(P)-dependent oxidoreductase [Sandaracinaceae bacterium LLY-WYZ-13_1]
MARSFEGHAAWITGGGSGIGRALALELARRGARVAVSGRREAKLAEVVQAIEAAGGRALAVPCDVTDESQVQRAADTVVRELDELDVAVANAGFAVAGPVETLSAEDWRRQLDVNVVGAAITAKHALAYLRETRGRLGLVGSVAAFVPLAKNGAYAASKYAVRALGGTLAIELAGSGVSCTTLHPGFVESEIAQVDNRGEHHADREDERPAQLMWPADKAAKVMVDALHARKREHVFTGHGRVGAFLGQHLPGLAVFAQARNRKKRKG